MRATCKIPQPLKLASPVSKMSSRGINFLTRPSEIMVVPIKLGWGFPKMSKSGVKMMSTFSIRNRLFYENPENRGPGSKIAKPENRKIDFPFSDVKNVIFLKKGGQKKVVGKRQKNVEKKGSTPPAENEVFHNSSDTFIKRRERDYLDYGKSQKKWVENAVFFENLHPEMLFRWLDDRKK